MKRMMTDMNRFLVMSVFQPPMSLCCPDSYDVQAVDVSFFGKSSTIRSFRVKPESRHTPLWLSGPEIRDRDS
jgi:hypothetical protein